MIEMINKVEFEKLKFSSHGIIEEKNIKGLSRVPEGWAPTNTIDTEIREAIRDIMWEKSDEYRNKNDIKITDYDFIETYCRIPSDTIKKAISGRYKITRRFLAKFIVGLKLDIEKANYLFTMHSGELNFTNDFDYIVYHALKSKDDIDIFIDEVETYLGINLDRDKL